MKRRFKLCPTCGFAVVNDEIAWLFRGKQRRIYETVARAGNYGIQASELVDCIYGQDISGGPDSATNSISVQINRTINPRLAPHGLKIHCARGRGMQPYRLVTLKPPPRRRPPSAPRKAP